ncbi:hypothetical protein H490_0113405 [Leucobacter sp. UCD-THU]|uniref:DUF1684 domain-containing protein n=1 Tax=Leucobacter sp. UCD-THU TaxID=1292023 RepID=UPI000378931A|nr:DUF1684 domain-containing protein [Leucobacter sp. UCD-THU]EYT51995.1 hypothetical protein H490_0113405 [Leucobacter sp. UCD-THU]
MTARAAEAAGAADPGSAEDPRPSRAAFAGEWREWQRRRLATAAAPHGTAALALTRWLDGEPRAVPGLPGLWRAQGGDLVGSDFEPGDYALPDGTPLESPAVLAADGHPELAAGSRVVRRFERDGSLAIRVFDPEGEGRRELRGIDAFDPDESWRVDARFEPGAEQRQIELADGYLKTAETSGSLAFSLNGQPLRLTATVRPDAVSVVFGDTTNGDETYGFRFLAVPLPDADGRTEIDFNRAFLPPCAFSDQFVCPLPTPENRLPVAIRAGERRVRRASPDGARTRVAGGEA